MQHRFKTESGEYLAVAVPEDIGALHLSKDRLTLNYSVTSKSKGFREFKRVTIQQEPVWGDYDIDAEQYLKELRELSKTTIVGPYPGLTEEQAAGIVESFELGAYADYTNYNNGLYYYTALESFASLMEAERLYTVNPIAKPNIQTYGHYPGNSFDEPGGWMLKGGEEAYYLRLSEWQAAEDRASKQWIILKLK